MKPMARARLQLLGWVLAFIAVIALITWIGGGWIAWQGG
jgi:hypothetical protein